MAQLEHRPPALDANQQQQDRPGDHWPVNANPRPRQQNSAESLQNLRNGETENDGNKNREITKLVHAQDVFHSRTCGIFCTRNSSRSAQRRQRSGQNNAAGTTKKTKKADISRLSPEKGRERWLRSWRYDAKQPVAAAGGLRRSGGCAENLIREGNLHRKWATWVFQARRKFGAAEFSSVRAEGGKNFPDRESHYKMLVRKRTREFQTCRFCFGIFLSATRPRIARRNFSRSAGLPMSTLRFIASATVLA